jgi:hypothetical protein
MICPSAMQKLIRISAVLLLTALCSCGKKSEARNALEEARLLAQKGDYAGALEKHVWFHENILKTDPSLSGVRLTFALADWVKLGEKYPEALVKLRAVRDEKTARLQTGQTNWEMFQEVDAINEYLNETDATVKLFKRIDAAKPDFAASVYPVAADALIGNGEFELAKKYMGDPAEAVADAIRRYQDNIKRIADGGTARDASRRAFENIFTEDVVSIITVLQNTGNKEQAKQIRAEALKTLDNAKIRGAAGK